MSMNKKIPLIVIAALSFSHAAFATSPYETPTNSPFKIQSVDEDYWFTLGGKFQFDALVTGTENVQRAAYPNGMNVRRARTDVRGHIGPGWSAKFETDFSNSSKDGVEILDAYLGYHGMDKAYFAFGQISQPLGFENWMAPEESFFMEKALVVGATDPGYGLGGFAEFQWETFSAMAALYTPREGLSQSGGNLTSASDPYGISGRVTWAPVNQENLLIHFGASTLYQDTNLRTDSVEFSTTPEMEGRITFLPYTTGAMLNASNYHINAFELASQIGDVSALFEYQHIHVDRDEATVGGDVNFHGYSLTGSYALLGEKRSYSARSGTFNAMKRQSNKGAWELVARYSYLNLGDENGLGQRIGAADSATNFSAGVNWWHSNNLRVSFNAVSSSQPNGVKLTLYGLRGQFSWE